MSTGTRGVFWGGYCFFCVSRTRSQSAVAGGTRTRFQRELPGVSLPVVVRMTVGHSQGGGWSGEPRTGIRGCECRGLGSRNSFP